MYKNFVSAAAGVFALFSVLSMPEASYAATTGVHIGTFAGNEECPQPGGNKTTVAELAGSFCVAKFGNGDQSQGEQGGDSALTGITILDNFTLTGAGTSSGTFSFDDENEGISITHLILKASSEFAVYALNGATSGDWMTSDHLGGKDISHISFFGSVSTVPIPAALPLLLTAIAGLGFCGRRRKLVSARL